MEFILQQEGSLGIVLMFITLLVALLYILLPLFAWRIWYWSRQNSRHLQDIGTKLELLIRDIAPDALPAQADTDVETAPDDITAAGELAVAGAASTLTEGEEESIFEEREYRDTFSEEEEESPGFTLADQFEDMSDELSTSEISDFTGGEATETTPTGSAAGGNDDGDDELVMDFEEEEATADASGEIAGEEFPAAADRPSEIPVTETGSFEFTVEHFESNEEKSFEFEDVDDDAFAGPGDTFDEESLAAEAASGASDEDPDGDFSSEDDIWGSGFETETVPASSRETARDDEFTFGDDLDLGTAFDEPAPEKSDETGDVAASFLADLENRLNLGAFSTPEPKTEPEPQPEPAPRPPTPKPAPESAAAPPAPEPKPVESPPATLFARCEGCGHKLAYKQTLSGKRVRCPACRTAFALP